MSVVNRSQRSRFSLQFVARRCKPKGQEKYLELNKEKERCKRRNGQSERVLERILQKMHTAVIVISHSLEKKLETLKSEGFEANSNS